MVAVNLRNSTPFRQQQPQPSSFAHTLFDTNSKSEIGLSTQMPSLLYHQWLESGNNLLKLLLFERFRLYAACDSSQCENLSVRVRMRMRW